MTVLDIAIKVLDGIIVFVIQASGLDEATKLRLMGSKAAY